MVSYESVLRLTVDDTINYEYVMSWSCIDLDKEPYHYIVMADSEKILRLIVNETMSYEHLLTWTNKYNLESHPYVIARAYDILTYDIATEFEESSHSVSEFQTNTVPESSETCIHRTSSEQAVRRMLSLSVVRVPKKEPMSVTC